MTLFKKLYYNFGSSNIKKENPYPSLKEQNIILNEFKNNNYKLINDFSLDSTKLKQYIIYNMSK